ncbi:hypothetical protein DFH09DRAFT_921570 [Mycena vulgaris]|nr:hypothetical protein DFH09DRAFT_921570 [Mycena vulgaris]
MDIAAPSPPTTTVPSETKRQCSCKCPPECRCACTCPDHCSCSDTCAGQCYKSEKPGRNLVVSIDGTSNQFGPNNTNVVELHSRILKHHPSAQQLTFYVSGIGTYAPPSFRSLAYWSQVLANILDLAIAWNFERHVKDAYQWLADNYQRGDKIFLFGFSRGEYQVRALAGMIATLGLIYPGNHRNIPFAYELYAKRYKGKATDKVEELCKHFKETFSREDHDVRVHFVGAWDTVSSVGIFRGQPLPLTGSADHICHFRHALAIDERRVKFLPEYIKGGDSSPLNRTGDAEPEGGRTRIKEVWFAGTHSDILDLAGVPLLWMENEATTAGLHLRPRDTGGAWDWDKLQREGPQESLTGPFWWFMETLPLTRPNYNARKPKQTTW